MQDRIATLNEGLARLHGEVREHFPFVTRIGVALFDERSAELKTFLHSPLEGAPLHDYRVPLASARWLDEVRRSRRARVIDDLSLEKLGTQEHSRRIVAAGFKASYTAPIFDAERFLGFVFVDSDVRGSLTPRVVRQLELFVRILSLTLQNALRSVDVLAGGLRVLRGITAFRDVETSGHLARMAVYAERIARRAAPSLGRDETWVEFVRLFAPLHDIGKIAVPDAILLKPARLTPEEMAVMKTHAVKGEKILAGLVRDLALSDLPYVDSLLAIARHHHERWDGEGYPDRLAGEAIPVEARVIHLADVFDALTTRRCYKEAWGRGEAEAYLRARAGTEFDPALVELFLEPAQAVAEMMERFSEEPAEAIEAV
jgi:HD-GYP domain-containing protein (c-di-GMP phosphodiesterase class II)